MVDINKRVPTTTTTSLFQGPDATKASDSASNKGSPETPGQVAGVNQQSSLAAGGSPQAAPASSRPDAPVPPASISNAHDVNGAASTPNSPIPPVGSTALSSTLSYPNFTAASPSTSRAPKISSKSANDQLSNGALAGVVVAVALGLALLTFLATFFMMRRKKGSQKERQTPVHEKPGYMDADRKGPLVTAGSPAGDSLMNSLPQSADDATIQRSVEATLEQIRLHIENFYQNTPSSGDEVEESDLKSFDSTYLPAPLAMMLSQSTKATPILKHTLSNLVTTSVSPTGSPAQSLLPAEFVLLPSKTRLSKSSTSEKPGFEACFSRWRQLTAYLLPNPLENAAYRNHRNRQIDNMVRGFSRVFAPWENLQYGSDQRSNSLSAIFKGASELGVLLFSQPSEINFRWPNSGDSVGPNQLAITPTLVKTTDEWGAGLHVPQVLVEAEWGRF